MRIECAWCGLAIGEKPGDGITHGCCPACFAQIVDAITEGENTEFTTDQNDRGDENGKLEPPD